MFKSIFCLTLVMRFVELTHHVPTATITVYKPRGLQMSIPDHPGVELVTFNVSVNRPSKGQVDVFEEQIFSAKQGKWSFDRSGIEVEDDDVLSYALHVLSDGIRYIETPRIYVVKERETRRESATPPPTILHVTTPSATTPLTMASLPPTMPPLDDCSVALNTALEMMSKLQIELKSANNDLEILKEIASSQPLYLHMSGSAVQEGDPKYVVEFMIFEKLHTNLKVKDAWRNGTSITFELPALEQKLEVLRRVKTYMKDSKNVVITV